jgi:cyclopropane fatty-acyl-phospholipid synthase-like methyltransferase
MTDHGRHSIEEFDASYRTDKPPWDIDRPQPPLAAVADQWVGHFLDAGCGTGEHALLAASRGLDAVGVDAAPTAIARAEEKARQRGLDARFVVADALDLPSLGESFDTVVDCGLFHVFGNDDRARYVRSLSGAVSPGGRVFLLCFSDRQPGDWGPRRVTQTELRESFTDGWEVDSVEPAELEVTFSPEPVQAWLATITRRPGS